MSSLLDRNAGLTRSQGSVDVLPSPLGSAVIAAIRAVSTGIMPFLVPVVLAWVLGAGGQATWSQALRFAVGMWLLAHHAGLAIPGGHVGLVPLGLIVAPAFACWFAGLRLARSLDARAERIEAGASRAVPAALSWRVLLAFSGVYCVLTVLASFVASMSGLRPISGQALVGAAMISLSGGGLGAVAYRHSGVRAGVLALLRRSPVAARSVLRAAGGALAVWIGGGAALVGVMIVTHASGVTGLYRALDAGAVGGAILTLGQLTVLPNLVVWACAVTSGPGFVIGGGATVTVTASVLGPLPAVPVLAALPAPGRFPAVAITLLALPVLAGVVAGALVLRSPALALRAPAATLVARLRVVGAVALVCGATAALLAWLSGGPAGPGRLAYVGPDPLATGLAFAVEVAVGASAVVLVAEGRSYRL